MKFVLFSLATPDCFVVIDNGPCLVETIRAIINDFFTIPVFFVKSAILTSFLHDEMNTNILEIDEEIFIYF